MAKKLGKIEKPPVEKYSKGRKLFFVPLLFSPAEPEDAFVERARKYWDEVEAHVTNLELKLGSVNKVFHELVPVGGEEGSKVIEELNSASHQIVRARLDKGAEVQPIEDIELLTEFMDWSRCLAVGLQNPKVLAKVYESYSKVRSKRNEDMAKKIDKTLKEQDIGILLMREGHQVQFPTDIEVFYVAPPGLDEIKRWIRAREEELQTSMDEDSTDKDSEE
ncbi:MAG: hypothetical protein E3J81_09130 [Dehalococcoidia bacterium]|nr:MAG: hypothetical protein E3J81_09130 [Dehalococcoidia bacterium]